MYAVVRVYGTLRQMRKAIGRGVVGEWVSPWRAYAFTNTFTRVRSGRGRQVTLPHFGNLYLARGWLGTEVLSHEATHLAIGWARRKGVMPPIEGTGELIGRSDEAFCYAVGQLTRAIVTGCYRRGLLG